MILHPNTGERVRAGARMGNGSGSSKDESVSIFKHNVKKTNMQVKHSGRPRLGVHTLLEKKKRTGPARQGKPKVNVRQSSSPRAQAKGTKCLKLEKKDT